MPSYEISTEWKAECPKCSKVATAEDNGLKCSNCDNPLVMQIVKWRGERIHKNCPELLCQKCGNTYMSYNCSDCGASVGARCMIFKQRSRGCGFMIAAAVGLFIGFSVFTESKPAGIAIILAGAAFLFFAIKRATNPKEYWLRGDD